MRGEQLVTVIIPTYKRPTLVPRAIESVRRQTHRNIEILVIDDCSGDSTGEVVRAIPDTRLKYIRHEVNKGLPANFDAVACIADVNGKTLRVHRGSTITLNDLRRGSFAPSGLMAKTSVLRKVMFDESLSQGEDWDAFIRIAQGYSIGWVAEPLLIYNEGTHVRMTNEAKFLSGAELDKRTAILRKHREFFGERWFKYHLADTFLGYIGSKQNKLKSIAYAVKQCGVLPVAANLLDKLLRHARLLVWSGISTNARSK
jgi:GalNAc5-diNAcBac-PP-undecaprenol beta-1,3-glucosyltransferase